MPRGVKKENLPNKVCLICGRPFTWRKKWEKVWDEVTTCSKSCNHKRRLESRKRSNEGHAVEHEEVSVVFPLSRECPTDLINGAERVASQVSGMNSAEYIPSVEAEPKEVGGNEPNPEHSIIDNSSLRTEAISLFDLYSALQDAENGESDKGLESLGDDIIGTDPSALKRAQRKAAKKAQKAERCAQRQGRGDPNAGAKQCDMCWKSVHLLVRCMHQSGQEDWGMVCGKCWHLVSGGVADGDDLHPHYRYGGLWKNRRRQQQ